jgi:hypothetical protein
MRSTPVRHSLRSPPFRVARTLGPKRNCGIGRRRLAGAATTWAGDPGVAEGTVEVTRKPDPDPRRDDLAHPVPPELRVPGGTPTARTAGPVKLQRRGGSRSGPSWGSPLRPQRHVGIAQWTGYLQGPRSVPGTVAGRFPRRRSSNQRPGQVSRETTPHRSPADGSGHQAPRTLTDGHCDGYCGGSSRWECRYGADILRRQRDRPGRRPEPPSVRSPPAPVDRAEGCRPVHVKQCGVGRRARAKRQMYARARHPQSLTVGVESGRVVRHLPCPITGPV